MSKSLFIKLDRDGWTKGIQLSIDIQYPDGGGNGYRLAGPKFNGSSSSIFSHKLTERDAKEIRSYLDRVFPVKSEAEPDIMAGIDRLAEGGLRK